MVKTVLRLRSEGVGTDAVTMLDREDMTGMLGHDKEMMKALAMLREDRCLDPLKLHPINISSPICYGAVS